MGLFSSKVNTYEYIPFIIERQLSVEPINIILGVCSRNNNNPFRNQSIKINNESKPYSLQRFGETQNSLTYDFENNIKLTLMKSNTSNDIYYNLKTDEINITHSLTNIIRKWYKPIYMNSKELDKISEFIKE